MLSQAPYLSLRPDSPLRPPAWRWELAGLYHRAALADKPDLPDLYVTRAAKFIADMDSGGTMTRKALAQVMLMQGAIADAYNFWQDAAPGAAPPGVNTDNLPLSPQTIARAEMEGLILAGKSREKVAAHTGLSVESVELYEKLWFDVRDRLTRHGWIATNIIGSLHQGTVSTLLPALVRAYGFYTKSARVVKAVASSFDAPMARAAAKSPGRFFAADAVQAGGFKAALAVRLMPLYGKTYARVIELHHEAVELEAKNRDTGSSDAENRFRDAVAELSSRVNWGYGKAPTNLAESRVQPATPRLAAHDE